MNRHKNLHAPDNQSTDSNKKIIYLSVLGDTLVTLHILTAHTRKMLALRMFKQVHSCMEIVNRIYESGNEPQKNAVVTLYIPSFLHLQSSCTKAEWNLVKAIMPGLLYKAYIESLTAES